MNASVRLDGLSSSVQNGVSNDLVLNKSGDGSMDRYLYISSAFTLGSARVYMAKDEKTVLPASGSLDLRLGNAAYGSYDKLEDYGDKLDWSKPYASFWVQRAGGAELTVGRSFDASLPVYALALATGRGRASRRGGFHRSPSRKDGQPDRRCKLYPARQ